MCSLNNLYWEIYYYHNTLKHVNEHVEIIILIGFEDLFMPVCRLGKRFVKIGQNYQEQQAGTLNCSCVVEKYIWVNFLFDMQQFKFKVFQFDLNSTYTAPWSEKNTLTLELFLWFLLRKAFFTNNWSIKGSLSDVYSWRAQGKSLMKCYYFVKMLQNLMHPR